MAGSGHLHFLGIAGHAMRGLALACRKRGYEVTGTDEGAKPPGTDWLEEQGITCWDSPDPAHLDGVTEVIVSGGTPPDYPELQVAKERDISIKSFAQLAGELTSEARRIVVAGTHGKTTVTSLLSWIFEVAKRQPDFLVGIQPRNFDSSVRLAGSDLAILEGDEYRASQLDATSKFDYYHPDVLIVTSVEMDHPDFFRDYQDIAGRFVALVRGLPEQGRFIYSNHVDSDVAKAAGEKREIYGGSHRNDRGILGWFPGNKVSFTPDGLEFSIRREDELIGRVKAGLYGRHNVENIVGATAVAMGEGILFDTVAKALSTFKGAARRFEAVSQPGAKVTVLDDYAHHPTEVKTTIEAAKLHFSGRVIAIFQPHTYSRTKELLEDYRTAFRDADQAFIATIEGAREHHLQATVQAADVAAVAGEHVEAVEDRAELVEKVVAATQPGDTVLCMTVGGHQNLVHELARRVVG